MLFFSEMTVDCQKLHKRLVPVAAENRAVPIMQMELSKRTIFRSDIVTPLERKCRNVIFPSAGADVRSKIWRHGMTNKRPDADENLRDGLESLPEPLDLVIARTAVPHVETDDDLDEALQETFPASDPPASFRTA